MDYMGGDKRDDYDLQHSAVAIWKYIVNQGPREHRGEESQSRYYNRKNNRYNEL